MEHSCVSGSGGLKDGLDVWLTQLVTEYDLQKSSCLDLKCSASIIIFKTNFASNQYYSFLKMYVGTCLDKHHCMNVPMIFGLQASRILTCSLDQGETQQHAILTDPRKHHLLMHRQFTLM